MFGDTRLQNNVKNQIKSLFVGVVINEDSLIDYAYTKKYLNYHSGYSFVNLQKVQNNINAIKSSYPHIYSDFRKELMNKIFFARPNSFFTICDAYIKAIMSIDYMSDKEVRLALDKFIQTII